MPEPLDVHIDSMSHEGRGIAHIDGKTVFVFAALEGEKVKIQIQQTRPKFDQATTLEVLEASSKRCQPKCDAFQVCGGCSLQHMGNDDQVEFKQQSLLEMMKHAGVEVSEVMPALRSEHWGYRKKARLGVKFVRKKGRVLVGFRERSAPFLADMSRCEVLLPEVGHKLDLLADLVDSMDAKEYIPQIEVAADDEHVILVFRILKPITDGDRQRLQDFAIAHHFWVQLQPGGPETVVNLYPEEQQLFLKPVKEGPIKIAFDALDFIQVNSDINQQMVAQAIRNLDLQKDDQVLDLFCGLGNFTLPMAMEAAHVTAVEGDAAMVQRAKQSALDNQIENSSYHQADLFEPDLTDTWMKQRYDKILLDPPRSGAQEIAQQIDRFKASRIVYVSCQPSSLVRDSAIICQHGYRLIKLGVMDMFPQTAHIESMAVFETIKPRSR